MAKQLSITVRTIDRSTPDISKIKSGLAQLGLSVDTTVRKADAGGRRTEGTLDRISRRFGTLRAAALGAFAALGITFGVRGISNQINRVVGDLDTLAKAAKRLDIPVDQLSALKFQANLAGVEFESLASGVGLAMKNIGEFALTGTGEAAPALKLLGVNLRDSRGHLKGMSDVLPDLAESLERIEDPIKRMFLARQIFGRQGGAIIQLIQQGSDNLRIMREQAERLGAIVTPEQAAAAEALRDGITRIQAAWRGLAHRAVAEYGPAIAGQLNRFASLIAAVPEMFGNLTRTIRTALTDSGGPGDAARGIFGDWVNSAVNLGLEAIHNGSGVLAIGALVSLDAMIAVIAPEAKAGIAKMLIGAITEAYTFVFKHTAGRLIFLSKQEQQGFMDEMAQVRSFIEGQVDSFFGVGDPLERYQRESWDAGRRTDDLRTALEHLAGGLGEAGRQFIENTDALLGFSEALARTSIEGLKTRDAIRRMIDDDSVERSRSFMQGVKDGLEELERRGRDVGAMGEQLVTGIAGSLEGQLSSAIGSVVSGTKSLKAAWLDAGRAIISEISAITTRLLIMRLIGSAVGMFGRGSAAIPPSDLNLPDLAGPGVQTFARHGGRVESPLGGRIVAMAGGGVVPGNANIGRDMVHVAAMPGEGFVTRRGMELIGGHLPAINRGAMPATPSAVSVSVHAPVTVIVQGGSKEAAHAAGASIGRGLAHTVVDELERNPGLRRRLLQ